MALLKRLKYQTVKKVDLLLVVPLHVRQILILDSFFCINY